MILIFLTGRDEHICVLNPDEEMVAVRDLVALLAYPHPPDQKKILCGLGLIQWTSLSVVLIDTFGQQVDKMNMGAVACNADIQKLFASLTAADNLLI